jgi:hypothetical protein
MDFIAKPFVDAIVDDAGDYDNDEWLLGDSSAVHNNSL